MTLRPGAIALIRSVQNVVVSDDEASPPLRETFRDALSVALTVGAYGVAFGAAGVSAGFSVLQTCLF
jgi:predicted branched-subunit amino acid permease